MDIVLKYFPTLDDRQVQQFKELASLYSDWNSKINVISRKDLDSLYERHVLHSLSIAAAFSFQDGQRIIDIGTGGGFPGIPLAIFFPGLTFHLVDSIAKKLKVVDEVVKSIGLQNVSVQQARAGDRNSITGNFDFVVSRAVASLGELWSWSQPLLNKPKGALISPNEAVSKFPIPIHPPALICLKGGDLQDEIKEAGLKPEIIPIDSFFQEAYFKEKSILVIRQRRRQM